MADLRGLHTYFSQQISALDGRGLSDEQRTGPNRRAIRALFDTHPDEAFTTDNRCAHCYGLDYAMKADASIAPPWCEQ
jgi:hypothetical protein